MQQAPAALYFFVSGMGNIDDQHRNTNMYFHGVKSTAHPPIKGALGHSTDCIVEQPNTAANNICLHSCKRIVSCWKRNSGLKQKLHLQTSKHTGKRIFKICVACLFPIFFITAVCACGGINVAVTKFQKSCEHTVSVQMRASDVNVGFENFL